MSEPILVDRSRIEQDARCQRLRYLSYEYCGRGLNLDNMAVPLNLGSCVHEGIAAMIAPKAGIAVADLVGAHGVLTVGLEAAHSAPEWAALVEPTDQDLVEAIVRTWWAVVLPQLRGWTVLEVEREETFHWKSGYNSAAYPVVMMSRLDLLARAGDGATMNGLPVAPGDYVWNWKTAKRCDERWKAGFLYDAQLLTELLGVEQRLDRKMTGCVIGGLVKEDHPLVWAWRNVKDGELKSRYAWTCEGVHQFKYAKGGFCAGGAKHRLGADWERVAVRDLEGGQNAWFNKLLDDDPAILSEWTAMVGPLARRSDYEVEEWCEMNLPREVEIAAVRSTEPLDEATLRRVFPKKTANHNCIAFAKFEGGRVVAGCPALDFCWGGAVAESFEWRSANHEAERLVHLEGAQ